MAVNKNFVVKNGIEVNTNLIVADTDSNKVGIGTTVPEYTLHVFEGTGIGASMVYVTGISTSLEEFNVGVGGTTFTAISNAAAGIAGSVGVGTDLPGYLLEVHAPVSTGQTALFVRGDMHVTGDINLDDITLNELKVTGISTFEDNIFVGSAATVGLHTVHFADHATATFGDGEDLKIYHDESNSYILEEGTGSLIIDSNQLSLRNADTDNVLLDTTSAGAVRVRYNGNTKLETNAIGVEVSGTFQSTGITTLASAGGISTTGGDLYVGGNLFVSDNITLDTNLNILGIATIATLRVSDTATGESGTEALIVGTGLSVRGSSTGVAVTLAGAGGITTTGGDFYVGGDLYISEDVILDTNLEIIGIATIGTLQVSSTSGINTILSTVESTSKDTGSLVLEGGLGIEKQLYVGAGASVGAGLTVAGDILPEADGTRDLGSSGAEFKDLYIDGTANIDSLTLTSGSTVTTILDEDDMSSNSATALVTQQSIKAYVDTQITAEDLDFAGDSGTGAVDLDSQSLTIAGTANEIETSASSQTLTIGLPDFVTVSNGLNVTGNGSTTTTLNVSGISTFSEDILIGTAATVGFGSTAFFRDDAKAIFGDGNDLQIYHNGSRSIIEDSGSGSLEILATNFVFKNAADNKNYIFGADGGAVKIYHNGTEKFETGPAGTITVGVGTFDGLSLGDNEKALFGAGDDLQIYHNGTNNYIDANGDFYLRVNNGTETALYATANGATQLNYDNAKKFETGPAGTITTGISTADGFSVGDNEKILLGNGNDLEIYHDGTNSVIGNTTGNLYVLDDNAVILGSNSGTETYLKGVKDGAVEIYYDAGKKFETTGAGVTVTGVGTFSQSISIASSVYHLGDDNTHFGFPAADTFTVYTAGSERVRVTSGGLFGIGTNNPQTELEIQSATDPKIRLESQESGNKRLELYIDGGEAVGTIAADQSASQLAFRTAGSERLRIGSSGQIGLGGANYGTSGQVLTSNGSGSAPTWQDASGGGAGGISTTHQQVESTSATGISTFSTTEYRSAHMLVGITQGTSYQTGRYLIIHDNTTPTILEESALATGDMIATFDATIAGGNLTVRVNMSNAGLATVAVKMDTIKSDSSS